MASGSKKQIIDIHTNGTSPSGSPPPSESESSAVINVDAIVGGVVGFAALLLACTEVFWLRRRRRAGRKCENLHIKNYR